MNDNPYAAPHTAASKSAKERTADAWAWRFIWSNAACCVIFLVAGMWNIRPPFGGFWGPLVSQAGALMAAIGCAVMAVHATLCWRWTRL